MGGHKALSCLKVAQGSLQSQARPSLAQTPSLLSSLLVLGSPLSNPFATTHLLLGSPAWTLETAVFWKADRGGSRASRLDVLPDATCVSGQLVLTQFWGHLCMEPQQGPHGWGPSPVGTSRVPSLGSCPLGITLASVSPSHSLEMSWARPCSPAAGWGLGSAGSPLPSCALEDSGEGRGGERRNPGGSLILNYTCFPQRPSPAPVLVRHSVTRGVLQGPVPAQAWAARLRGAVRASSPGPEPQLRPASSCLLNPVLSTELPQGPSSQTPGTGTRRRTWKTMTKASRAARTAQKSLEMSYLCSDHGGSR